MIEQNLSLIHLLRQPQAATEKAPLLLLLHGYGSNEADLFSFAEYLDPRFFVVSARAPLTLMPGMYAWFSLEFTNQGIIADLAEAAQSGVMLGGFLDELLDAYALDGERVYLMGFSQGAMMSLGLGLARPDKVAGIVAMSGRLPQEARARAAAPHALEGLPILVTHGIYDDLIPVASGRDCRDYLQTLPVRLTYHEYPMGHEIRPEAFRDIRNWLREALDEGEEK